MTDLTHSVPLTKEDFDILVRIMDKQEVHAGKDEGWALVCFYKDADTADYDIMRSIPHLAKWRNRLISIWSRTEMGWFKRNYGGERHERPF